jgi:hypothetical protein
MFSKLTAEETDASVYGPLSRRELAELVAWLDDVATTASLAVPAAVTRPGASATSVAGMAGELCQLASETAAWQARTA